MRVLAIGAHADDIELGAGGTIAKHAAAGHDVNMVVVTHSAYKGLGIEYERSKEVATEEAIQASKILGASNISFLDFETRNLQVTPELIDSIESIVKETKPDVIYTHWNGDVHQDHRAVAESTLIATRSCDKVLMYRSNWYKSIERFNGCYYVDISTYIDKKLESIHAHVSECSRRSPDWIEFFVNACRNSGMEIGVKYAETFQPVKWVENW
jgi:LmbE family N-acetylglucosaminyl deacetylase